MESLPTVEIVNPDPEVDGKLIINEADFVEGKHVLWADAVAEAEKKAAAAAKRRASRKKKKDE